MTALVWVQIAGGLAGFIGAVLAAPDAFSPKKIDWIREQLKRATQAVRRVTGEILSRLGLLAVSVLYLVVILISQYLGTSLFHTSLLICLVAVVGIVVLAVVTGVLSGLSRLVDAGTADSTAFLKVGGAFITIGFLIFVVGTVLQSVSVNQRTTTSHGGLVRPP